MLAHRANPQAHDVFQLFVLPLGLEQLVRDIERGHHGYAVEPDDLAAVADLAHLQIEELRRREQCRLFLERAGDVVLFLQDLDRDVSERAVAAHETCSIPLSRPIIASTRPRTCSFLCSSVARSDIRESCRCRSDLFSSCNCRQTTTSSSSRFSSRFNSRSTRVLAWSGVMRRNIEPR